MLKTPGVMIDAGHYAYYNQSPVVPEYWESRRMWDLHLLLKKELEAYGIKVGTTRDNLDKDLAVVDRGKLAEGWDLFLSLHSNAVGDGVDGFKTDRVSVYAAYDNLNDSHVLASKLAGAIADLMEVSAGYVKTRKSEKGDWEYYGVLRGARSVGCPLYYIIEHSFHTNEAATRWLMDDTNLKRLAKLEAAVIAEYFGIATKYTLGDVNGDGTVDAFDYMLIKSAVMGRYELSEEQKQLADMNDDGEVDVFDCLLVKRVIMTDTD